MRSNTFGLKPIESLQCLRAIAALSVLFHHACYFLIASRSEILPMPSFSIFGFIGVQIFFAISGFLMANISQNITAGKFLIQRLIRIYPLYLLLLTIVVFINKNNIYPDIYSSLLIPPCSSNATIGVEWTLYFEIFFYIVVYFCILFKIQKNIHIFGIIWIFCIFTKFLIFPNGNTSNTPLMLGMLLSPWCLSFAGGLLIPEIMRRGWATSTLSIFGLCALMSSQEMPNQISIFLSSAFASICIVIAFAKSTEKSVFSSKNILFYLGGWSYALYLCHVPILRYIYGNYLKNGYYISDLFFGISLSIFVSVFIGQADIYWHRYIKYNASKIPEKIQELSMLSFVVFFIFLVSIPYFKIVKSYMLNESSNPLAVELQGKLHFNVDNISNLAEKSGFVYDPKILGFFDTINDNEYRKVFFRGWAIDTSPRTKAVKIMVYGCGSYLGLAMQNERRPDVPTALHIPYHYFPFHYFGFGRDYGFNSTFYMQTSCDKRNFVALVITDDNRYSIIRP